MAVFFDSGYFPGRRTSTGQGWVYLILAVWLFVSPWVLGFGQLSLTPDGPPTDPAGVALFGSPGATLEAAAWNAWIVGGVLFLVAAATLAHIPAWEDYQALVLGAWIFAAPWVLGFSRWWPSASWDHWLTGLVLFGFAAWCLPGARVRY